MITKTETIISPYRDNSIEYMMNGWEPFPLPLGAKFPPPKGMTGKNREVEYDEYTATTEWFEGDSNIAIRLPNGVIGIDIDGHEGVQSMHELQESLGELPFSFAITSRVNPLEEGYTMYFTVPEGREVLFAGIGKKIDIIRSHHRYSVVSPSIHPDGREYRWIDNDGNNLYEIPMLFDCEPLPEKWVEYLCAPMITEKTVITKKESILFEAIHLDFDTDGKMCLSMQAFTKKVWMEDSGSRHDSTMMKVLKLASMAKSEHKGFDESIDIVKKVWVNSFHKDEIDRRNIGYEFESMVRWALENAKPFSNSCKCKKRKSNYPF